MGLSSVLRITLLALSCCCLATEATGSDYKPPKVPRPTDAQREALARSKIAMVEMTYDAEGQTNIENSHIFEIAKMLKHAGVTRYSVMPYTPGEPDLDIHIEFEGNAICPTYEVIGASCTGAEVEGTITFKRPDIPPYVVPFEGAAGGGMMTSRKDAANNAPFSDALTAQGSFYDAFMEALVAIHGEKVLANAWSESVGRPVGRWLNAHLKQRGTAATDFLLVRLGQGRRAEALLAAIGDPRAIPALSARLTAATPYDRAFTVEKLALFDTPERDASLIAALDDPHAMVRTKAIEAIAKHRIQNATPKLIAIAAKPVPAARRDEETERECRARGLGGDAYYDCVKKLRDEASELRWQADARRQAFKALGELGAKDAAETLAGITATEPDFKQSAAIALAKLGDLRAVPALLAALQASKPRPGGGPSYQHVARLIGALGDVPTRAGIEELLRRLDDDNEEQYAYAISQALEKISGKRYGKSARRWKSWWRENAAKYPE